MFLRLLLSVLFVLHSVSFAMDELHEDKKLSEIEIAQQEVDEERKLWQSLPQEKQGAYKLIRLYEKQDDPMFVARYLRYQDVPILVIDPAGDNENMYGIDPYTQWFYKDPDKQFFEEYPTIVERGCSIAEDIKKQYSNSYKGTLGSSLYSSVFLGKDEDIMYEFAKMDKLLQGSKLDIHCVHLSAITVAIKCPLVKNNGLELLLQREKKISAPQMKSEFRCAKGYDLLKLAAQSENKDVFELVAHQDPYNSNRTLYSICEIVKTHLDRMRNDNCTFDQEHIDIFICEGGMTTAEVRGMNYVDRILRGKVIDEERATIANWESVIDNSNRGNSNKYLESQRLLRRVQENNSQ